MSSLTTRLAAALVATTALAGAAQAADLAIPSGTYATDPTHTSLFWSLNHFGLSQYTARFNTVAATVELDAEVITRSTFTATIAMDSVDTDYPLDNVDFNAELQGADWLNAAAHPEATFVSTQIVKTSDTTATIEGDLSFRGVTLPVTLDAELIGALGKHPMVEAPAFGIRAVGTFDRTAFGLATFAPLVGAEVTIEVNAEFLGQDLAPVSN